VTLQQLQQSSQAQIGEYHERITLELQRSLDHFDRQYRFITLSKLVLCPLGEAGTELQAYLAANLYVPVEMMELAAILNISKVPELRRLEAQQHYFLAIGAALRDEALML
jgi:MSHA biogenesis protein MshI